MQSLRMTPDQLAQSLGYESYDAWNRERATRTLEQKAADALELKKWARAYAFGDAAYNGDVERMQKIAATPI